MDRKAAIEVLGMMLASVEADVLLAAKHGHHERTPLERWQAGASVLIDQLGATFDDDAELRRLREVERAAREVAKMDECTEVRGEMFCIVCQKTGYHEHAPDCALVALRTALSTAAGEGE